MPYSYATKNYDKEHMARTVGIATSISTKHAIEICSLLRHKSLARAKKILANAAEKKEPIPFTRFNRNVGHKKGIGPGRYPVKASQEILKLIESVEANAQFKGLNTSELVIEHMCAHRAGKTMRYGRQRGIRAKRTHVEIIVKESAKKESKKAPSKPKAEAPKKEAKAEKKDVKEAKKEPPVEKPKPEAKPAEQKPAEKAEPAKAAAEEKKKEKPKEDKK